VQVRFGVGNVRRLAGSRKSRKRRDVTCNFYDSATLTCRVEALQLISRYLQFVMVGKYVHDTLFRGARL